MTAVVTPLVYAGLTVAVHLLNPTENWMQYTLSDLALARYGWIETASFCILAVSTVCVGYGAYVIAKRRRPSAVSFAMFGVTAVALFVIAGFKSSDTSVVTPFVLVHRASVGVLIVCFPVACLTIVPSLRADSRWRGLATYCAVVGLIGVLLDIAGASLPRDIQQRVAGLWERLFVADGLVLCQVFGLKLLFASRRAHISLGPAQEPLRAGGR